MEWRWFTEKQQQDAQEHLKCGGILVQQTNCGHGRETGMLLATTVDELVKAGLEIGLNNKWLRKKGCAPHYELKGDPLRRAKRQCVNIQD